MGVLNKLTARTVSGKLKPGRHSDGGGLYLSVSKTGAKSWVFMWKKNNRRREIGLGSIISVTLASARQKAANCRAAVADNEDPRQTLKGVERHTFKDTANAYMEAKVYGKVHRANVLQWERIIKVTARKISDRDISTITTNDILRVLRPIWDTIPETARKSRARLENVFDYAAGRDWRSGENPARWKGNLSALLVAHDRSKVRHYPAMPIDELPEFLINLRNRQGIAKIALEFKILTASRTTEVLEAPLSEFDFENKVWNRPAERMKNKKPHSVPLSNQALTLIKPLMELSTSEYVFPGQKPNQPLCKGAMGKVLERMNIASSKAVPHGFRSTFSDWVAERTPFSWEIAEISLSHTVGNATERAYRRGSALEKRRVLMQAWADYCSQTETSNVVSLHA
jgi:integrase